MSTHELLSEQTQLTVGVSLPTFPCFCRYPGNVNLSFAYVEGESLIMGLKVGVLVERVEGYVVWG
jgi:hypothetical protein